MILNKIMLSEQIYDDITERIISGKIKQGQRLTIRELEKYYNVSSTPIRDALSKLARRGFLISDNGAPFQVITMGQEAIQDLLQLHRYLLGMSFDLILENNMVSTVLAEAEKRLEKQLALKNENTLKRIEAYIDFFNIFSDFTGNCFFDQLLDVTHGRFKVTFKNYTQCFDPDEALENSCQIYESFKKGDYEQSRKLLFYNCDCFEKVISDSANGN